MTCFSLPELTETHEDASQATIFGVALPTIATLYFQSGWIPTVGHDQFAAIGFPLEGSDLAWSFTWQFLLAGFFLIGLKNEFERIDIKIDAPVVWWHIAGNCASSFCFQYASVICIFVSNLKLLDLKFFGSHTSSSVISS